MKEFILTDERAMCADIIKKQYKKLYDHGFADKYKHIHLLGDKNIVIDYLLHAITMNNEKVPLFERIEYTPFDTNDYIVDSQLNFVSTVDFDSLEGDGAYLLFANCSKNCDNYQEKIEKFDELFQKMTDAGCRRCVLTVILPKLPDFCVNAKSFSESQYDFYLGMCPKTTEVEYYLAITKLFKKYSRKISMSMIRFTNIFAPDGADSVDFDLHEIIEQAYANREIVITDEDCYKKFSLSYVRNACQCVFLGLTKLLNKKIYNADESSANIAKLKKMIYYANPTVFAYKCNFSKDITTFYNVLDSHEIRNRKIIQPKLVMTGIKHVVSYLTGEEYDTTDTVKFYEGKIKTIQAIEVEILKEIDRICQKYDINYFLAGGTLLGAIRSGKSIPWDDDLDIGMLRDDFEKFKKVVENELDKKYSYSSPLNKSGSHYTIDKIRLDATYFSTNFSKKAVYPDGIFVDILIYDKTSNNKFLIKLHEFVLTVITHIIYIKWYNVVRRKFHYRFSKIMLPILRITPWPVFHQTFEFFAKIFRNKKDAKWLIDTVGKKLNDGPLPYEGYDSFVRIDFEGGKYPIPEDPTSYLNYAYGPTYMQMPPLSKRSCPHNFARIDLGKYVFDPKETTPFRNVDIRGELFESDDEF